MAGVGTLLKQAKKMQQKIEDMQKSLEARELDISSGGGAVQVVAGGRPAGTFPSRLPLLRIDHIFVDEEIGVRRSFVHDSPLARRASDHLPLCADIEIEEHLENSGQLGNLSAPA